MGVREEAGLDVGVGEQEWQTSGADSRIPGACGGLVEHRVRRGELLARALVVHDKARFGCAGGRPGAPVSPVDRLVSFGGLGASTATTAFATKYGKTTYNGAPTHVNSVNTIKKTLPMRS